jgi:hypothetical protein
MAEELHRQVAINVGGMGALQKFKMFLRKCDKGSGIEQVPVSTQAVWSDTFTREPL